MQGTRRRLTLAPGAFSPEPASESGSRFSALCAESLVDQDAETLAMEVAADVLAEDRLVSCDDVCRPAISECDLAKGFWAYVDSPSPANRFWEGSSSSVGGEVLCSSGSSCCRSSMETMDRRRAQKNASMDLPTIGPSAAHHRVAPLRRPPPRRARTTHQQLHSPPPDCA